MAAAWSQQRLRSWQALALAGKLATGEPETPGGAGGGAPAAARLEAAHMEAAFRDVAAARAHLDAALAALGLTVEVTGEDRVRVGIGLGKRWCCIITAATGLLQPRLHGDVSLGSGRPALHASMRLTHI